MIKRYTQAVAVVFGCALLLAGCDSRIVQETPNNNSLSISIDMSAASPKLLALVDIFRVVVTDDKTDSILGVFPLQMNLPFIEGQIDSLPAQRALRFTAEALAIETSIVLYQGVTTATLLKDALTPVVIDLSPVVSTLKYTPRNISIASLDSFAVDIKIFNVQNLYGASFRIRYDATKLRISSTILDTSLSLTDIIFFTADSLDNFSVYRAVAISNTVSGTSIADANGDTPLVRLFMTSISKPAGVADTTLLTLEPTGATLTDLTNFPAVSIFADDMLVEITQ